ncbi:hypothetical protein [Stenotrophomonas maltophilia group sp. Smal17]|uniref:hypothetical protein n=1 Tax=Stenotrophomonas maltophilia group sp. Smal17 TaxID=3377167 RepID=UPI0025578E1B|nr:hypothetical protein [Stenotrophomonas maltophilia]
MDNALLIIVLAVACIGVGIVRIGSWVIARHEQEQTRVLLQQVYAACSIAQARAELAATGWTAEDEASFQAFRGQQGVFLKHLLEVRHA